MRLDDRRAVQKGQPRHIDSANIIAEAILALQNSDQVAENDVAAATISWVVAGPISRSIWNEKGRCRGHDVERVHRDAVNAAFAPRAEPLVIGPRVAGGPEAEIVVAGPAVRIVSEIGF